MERSQTLMRALLALGAFGLGLTWGEPGAPIPAVEAQQSGYLPGKTQEQIREAGRSARRAWGIELAQKEASMRGHLDELLGLPAPWPADSPHEMSPSFFRDELLARFEEASGMTAVRVDCDNHPCMALFSAPCDDEDSFLAAIKARNNLHSTWGKARVAWYSECGIHADDRGTPWAVMGLGLLPAEASDAFSDQVHARIAIALIGIRTDSGLVPADID